MKHIHELTEKETEELLNKVADDLKLFMLMIEFKYGICTSCMHNLVSSMCEAYLERINPGDNENAVKH